MAHLIINIKYNVKKKCLFSGIYSKMTAYKCNDVINNNTSI